MRKIDRFDKYMEAKGLNDNKVTNELSLSIGLLGKSRKENRDLSDKVVEQARVRCSKVEYTAQE